MYRRRLGQRSDPGAVRLTGSIWFRPAGKENTDETATETNGSDPAGIRDPGGRSRFPFPKLLAPRRSRSGQLGLPPWQGSPGVACHGLHGWKHWAHHLNCIESSGHCDRLGPFPGSLLREQARGFPQEPSGIFLRGIEVLAGLSQRLRAVGALRQRPPRRNP